LSAPQADSGSAKNSDSRSGQNRQTYPQYPEKNACTGRSGRPTGHPPRTGRTPGRETLRR